MVFQRHGRAIARGLAALLGSSGFVGCGTSSLTLKAKVQIGMLGVFESPPDGTEDTDAKTEPNAETFTLAGVSLTKADGTTVTLYPDPDKTRKTTMPQSDSTTDTTFRIVDRPQIIYEAEVDDLVDTTVTSLTVTFGPSFDVDGRGGFSKTAVALPPPYNMPTYSEPFTIDKAKTQRLDVKIQWRGAIDQANSDDPQILMPSYVIELNP